MTDRDTTGQLPPHRPYTPEELQRGRQAALDAYDAHRAAIAWQLDRALDPEAPDGSAPEPWATVSGPLSVAEATAILRAMTASNGK